MNIIRDVGSYSAEPYDAKNVLLFYMIVAFLN